MKRILAIDDQDDNLIVYDAILSNYFPDYKLFTARSGKEGIEKAIENQPDVILLDIIMPGMDGYETCSKLKSIESIKNIPIILITAIKTDSASRVRGLEIGADAFLAKPIDPAEFAAQIKVMLRIKDAEDQLRADKDLLEEKVMIRTAQLKKNADFLSTIYNYSGIAIFVIKVNSIGDYVYESINRKHEELFGLKEEEYIGKRPEDLVEYFGHDAMAQATRNYQECILNKEAHVSEFEIPIDGKNEWWLSRITPLFDKKDRVYRIIGTAHNITYRKEIEEENLKNQSYLEKAQEIGHIGSWSLDLNKDELEWTEENYNIFGVKVGEPMNYRKFIELVHPDDRSYVEEKWTAGLNHQPYDIEHRLLIEDKVKWVREKAEIEFDANGKAQRAVGVTQDITKQKSQEIKLKHSYSFNESLLHTIPFGMDIVDLEGNILFVNPILDELFGSEILGKKCWEIYRDHKKQCENCPLKVEIVAGQTRAIESEDVLGGRTFEITHTGMNFKGQKAVMEVFYDITDRKRNEKIQEVVYNIANAVNSTLDLDDLNHSIKELLGEVIDTTNFFIALYDEEQGIISVPYLVDEMDTFSSIPLENSLTGHIIKTEKPLLLRKNKNLLLGQKEELEFIGSDSLIWLGVPLKYQEKVIGAIVVQSYHDENAYSELDLEILEYVSYQIGIAIERKKTEGELITALEKAKESDRLKSAFLANVSHEIRTPLNSILGFSDLVTDPEIDDEEKKGYVEIINSGGNQLLSIIDDILNISLIEAGQLIANIDEFNPKQLLKNVHRHFKSLNPSAKFELTVKPCPEVILKSDESKIKQVLNNLLTNAIKNTTLGEISLGYSVNKKTVKFHVHDTGKGIAPGLEDKLFERFYRVEDSSHLLPGTGLGLAISKAIVTTLGGKIWYKSELGVGTSFFFTIPIQ